MRKYVVTLAVAASLVAAQATPPALAAPGFSLSLAATPTNYAGPCPATIKLDGKIVNTPDYVASVKYSLLNNDGIDSAPMTATFDAAHTFAVHDGRTPSASGVYWVQLLVHNADNRVVARSEQARFVVRCTNGPNETPAPKPTPCLPGITANIPCPSPTPKPKPQQTPCVSTAAPCPSPEPCNPNGTVPCTHPTPCLTANGALCKLPDLTAGTALSVGGHSTAWGGGVTLTAADAIPSVLKQSGYCAFTIKYSLLNIGSANAGTFKSYWRVGATPVSIQTTPSLAAGASQAIQTQAYLPIGVHALTLDVNDGHLVTESNYANNHFAIKYQLTGKCRSQQS